MFQQIGLFFSGLEEEYNIHISEELKEYYNSYYFLELWGFRGDEGIRFDKVDDTTDVLAAFRSVLNDNEDMIEIGMDNRNSSICVKIDSGQVISKYWESEEEFVLADSLSEFF